MSERLRTSLIDIIQATILRGNINDKLWPELMLVMTYIKNNQSTRFLANNQSFHKAYILKK